VRLRMPNRSSLRFALTKFGVGMIVVHGLLFWVTRKQLVSGSSDFRIFYTAGLILRRGEGHHLYNEQLQSTVEREFASAAVARGGPLPYNHPPFEAALYLPMTYLPYFSAYCIWVLINLLLLWASVYHVRSWLPTLMADFRWPLMLAPLAFFPIVNALLQGQDSILLLLLYCLAYAAFRRREDSRAGVYLGFGLFKFHFILPFALILLLHRRWRALLGMFVIAVLESAVSWAMVGGMQLFYYPHFVWQVNRQQAPGVIAPANMPNLRGLFTGWQAMNPLPHWIEIALLATSLYLVFWASRQWRPLEFGDARGWDCGFSVCLVVVFLVGYHGYNQDMSFLLLPLLLALDRVLDTWSKASSGLKLVLGLMFLTPLYLILILEFSHHNLFSIVLLFLVGYLAASGAKAKPTASANRSTTQLSAPLP
jgi:hypothetical protein